MWRDDDDAVAVFEQAKDLEAGGRLRGAVIDDLIATARRGRVPAAPAAVHVLGFGSVPAKRLAGVVAALVDLMEDADLPLDVRARAAEALGDRLQCTKRSSLRRVVVARLVRQLDSRAPELRFWSAFSLGKLEATRSRHQLRRLVADEAVVPGWWAVGQEASDALDRIEGRVPPARHPSG